MPSPADTLNSLKELGCIQRDREYDIYFQLKLLVAPRISHSAVVFHLRHNSEDTSTQIQEGSKTRSSSRRLLGLALAMKIEVVTAACQGTVGNIYREHRITEGGKDL